MIMTPMKLCCMLATIAFALPAQQAAAAPAAWSQPAAALADQIAAILGPGQAHLTLRNLSKLPADDIPAIRRLLEDDLKARGVQASGAESANTVRITLSENLRGRLWVAEVMEGSETRVAMVRVDAAGMEQQVPASGLVLRTQTLLTTTGPVLAALETADALVAVEPEEIVLFTRAADGWKEQARAAIGQRKGLTQDPRSAIVLTHDGQGFEASLAGMACAGSLQPPQSGAPWPMHCRASDDPWPLAPSQTSPTSGDSNATLRAFYNAARNYFTGVLNPSAGVDLPPFFTAALLPRPDGAGLLLGGINGKVQLIETSALKPVTGTRDWGSDFAALHSGCGAGTQIIASGSGEALSDSLRAYEIPALEAIPSSTPLTVDGAVTALWTAPDGKSVLAVVRHAAAQNQADTYEVDRVTASCN